MRTGALIVLGGIVSLATAAGAAEQLKPGDPAPLFTTSTNTGEVFAAPAPALRVAAEP